MHLASYSCNALQPILQVYWLSQAKIPVRVQTQFVEKHKTPCSNEIQVCRKQPQQTNSADQSQAAPARFPVKCSSDSANRSAPERPARSDSGLATPSSTAAVLAYTRKSRGETNTKDTFSAFSTGLSLRVFLT